MKLYRIVTAEGVPYQGRHVGFVECTPQQFETYDRLQTALAVLTTMSEEDYAHAHRIQEVTVDWDTAIDVATNRKSATSDEPSA